MTIILEIMHNSINIKIFTIEIIYLIILLTYSMNSYYINYWLVHKLIKHTYLKLIKLISLADFNATVFSKFWNKRLHLKEGKKLFRCFYETKHFYIYIVSSNIFISHMLMLVSKWEGLLWHFSFDSRTSNQHLGQMFSREI